MTGTTLWYDDAGNFFELTRTDESGFFVAQGDGVFERVNEDGETIGFAVLNITARKRAELPFDVQFETHSGEA